MKNKKYFSSAVLAFFIIVFFIYMQDLMSAVRPAMDVIFLDDHWTITKDGQVYEDVRLYDYYFDSYRYGEEIEYRVVLPEDKIPNPILKFYSVHTAFEVILDGEVIYQNGMDILKKNVFVGYGTNYVTLPEDYYGKEVTFRCITAANDSFKTINHVEICDSVKVFREQCMDDALIMLINSFLIIFGCGILAVGVFFAHKIPGFFRLACVGGFSIGIAVWSLCNHDLITVFTYNLRAKTLLEFVTLYWTPIPFLLYFWDDVKQERRRILRTPYFLILNCQVLFTVGIFACQMLRITHMAEYLVVEHGLMFMMIVFVLSMNIYDLYHKNYEHVPLMVGIVLLLITALADVIWYNMKKYVPIFTSVDFSSALCIGTLLFVIGQIFDFCLEMSKGLYERARTVTLERMVYIDTLTGISNRRKCEEDMNRLDKSNEVYGIISFDLNDLKKVNDEIGHEQGDALIKDFAIILQRTFGEAATVGRMGGDEFIALFPRADKMQITDMLRMMNYYIAQKNEELEMYQIKVAYGYCQSDENPDMEVKDVFKAADERMYKMKYKMKGAVKK